MAKDIPTETFTIPDGTLLTPSQHLVKDGDTYASIAAANIVKGLSAHETAQYLYDLNLGKQLNPGVIISL